MHVRSRKLYAKLGTNYGGTLWPWLTSEIEWWLVDIFTTESCAATVGQRRNHGLQSGAML